MAQRTFPPFPFHAAPAWRRGRLAATRATEDGQLLRILALDGGGIRGIFTAAFLAHVEQQLKVRLVEHLGLLTGTSTGAIIALALASGMTARDALEAYKTAGPRIFGRRRGWWGRIFRPAHDNSPLIDWLKRMFGEQQLKDASVPIAIPTLEALTGNTRVWTSNHHPEFREGGDKKMWEVALASTAAPSYLPAVRIEGFGAYLDGGLWANNPSLVGLVEARCYLGVEFPSMRLLSIGTGRQKTSLRYEHIHQRGWLPWAFAVTPVVMAAQSTAAQEQARLLLGEERYLRIDEDLPYPIDLDDIRGIRDLEHLGREAGMKHLRDMERMLLTSD